MVVWAEFCMQGKQLYIQSVWPLLWWKQSSINNLPPDSWLVILANAAISGTHCWISCRQIGHSVGGIGRLALVSAISCCGDHVSSSSLPSWPLFMNPLGNDSSSWGKRHSIHQKGYPIYFIIKISSAEVTLWWTFTWDTIPSCSFPIQKDLSTYLFPKFLVTNFPIIFFPNYWPSSQTTGHNRWVSIVFNVLPFLLPSNIDT